MNRWTRELLWLLLPIAVMICQTAVVASTPWLAGWINLVVLAALLTSLVAGFIRGSAIGLLAAVGNDLHSALPFGISIVAVAAALAVFEVMRTRVLKNQAFHAYAINFLCAVLAENVSRWLLTLAANTAGLSGRGLSFPVTAAQWLAQTGATLAVLAFAMLWIRRRSTKPTHQTYAS
jgi:type III secretory pathway component EscS